MANSKTQVRMSSGIVNNGSQVNIWNGQCRTDIQRVEIEETPNNRSKKPNLFVERSKRFAEETSTHGVARVASAHSKLGRLFWTIVVIGAFVGLVIIIQMLMANFLRFPTNTISTIVSRNSDIFPAVTICNTNPVRTSKLKYSKYSSLVEFFENPNHRYYEPCLKGDFKCSEGGCLKFYKVCDGIWDCNPTSYESSDEKHCIYGPCRQEDFKCRTPGPHGKCISKDRVCDGKIDCTFAEDELNCECGQDEIECVDPRPDKINENHSHWCVRSDRVCDGVQDCQHPNDEEQCSVAVGPPMKIPGKCLMTQNRTNFILQVTENVTESWCESSYAMSSCFRCLSSHYNILTSECTTFRESHLLEDNELLEDSNCTYYYRNTSTHCNGYGCDDLTKCISKAKVCDFHEDCIDGSDEEGCTRPCFGDEFTCDNGQCLHKHKACDKIADCLDGSDEIDCPDECADTHFLCNDNQGERCILMYKKCDVIQDCTHPNDEDPTMCTMMIEQAMEETELFGDGWNDRFLSSVSNLSHFDTFKEIYSDLGFQRVMYEDPPDWKRFIAFSSTADNSDLKKVLKFGKDEANILGHQKEDMILDCKYGGKQCYPSDFLKTQNDVYGNCFTFNHGVNASLRNASKTGPAHGLELTLSTEQSEYTAIYGQESGIRVAVHPQGITLLPEDRGVSVPPGMKTSIGVRKRIISRQSEPYGHCLETKNENNWRVNDSSSYTELACRKLCVQTHVYNICGCVDSYILNIPIKPKCSVLNETQQMCTQFIHFLYQVGELPCDCPKHCLDVKFETKLSLAAWPSDVAARTLTHLFRQNKEKWKILSDNEAIRRNLLKVVVYYYDLNANLIAEVPAYQFFSLFSDLGGSLGLFVGVSLVTIVEFFEYVWDIFRLGILTLRGRMRS